jgi:hypothetical protein
MGGLNGLNPNVENHFDLCCFAASLTWIYAFNLEHVPDPAQPRVIFLGAPEAQEIEPIQIKCRFTEVFIKYVHI